MLFYFVRNLLRSNQIGKLIGLLKEHALLKSLYHKQIQLNMMQLKKINLKKALLNPKLKSLFLRRSLEKREKRKNCAKEIETEKEIEINIKKN